MENAAIESKSGRVATQNLIATPSRGLLRKLDRAIGVAIGVPTAALALFEVLVLLGGVVSRYAFHHPIIWTDELASTLFLWLAIRIPRAKLWPVAGAFALGQALFAWWFFLWQPVV